VTSREPLVVEVSAPTEEGEDAVPDPHEKPLDVGIVKRRRGSEGGLASGPPRIRLEHPVENERVEVRIQVDRRSEALGERDGTGVALRDSPLAGGGAEPGEEGSQEDGADLPTELAIEGDEIADSKGKRQHPLARVDPGQEGLQMLGENAVENGVLRSAPSVADAGKARRSPELRVRSWSLGQVHR
jgi:hypothetical protein